MKNIIFGKTVSIKWALSINNSENGDFDMSSITLTLYMKNDLGRMVELSDVSINETKDILTITIREEEQSLGKQTFILYINKGKSNQSIIQEKDIINFVNTDAPEEGIISIQTDSIEFGVEGKDAYQLAKEVEGFDGTVEEWLTSLKAEFSEEDKDKLKEEVLNKITEETNYLSEDKAASLYQPIGEYVSPSQLTEQLASYPTKEDIEGEGFLKEHQSLENYATKEDLVPFLHKKEQYLSENVSISVGKKGEIEDDWNGYKYSSLRLGEGESFLIVRNGEDFSNYSQTENKIEFDVKGNYLAIDKKDGLTFNNEKVLTESSLSDYAKKDELPVMPSLEGYATSESVNDKLSSYATKTYVDEQVSLNFPPAYDDSDVWDELANKMYTSTANSTFQKKTDMEEYAKKDELPVVPDNIITEDTINNYIPNDILTSYNWSSYIDINGSITNYFQDSSANGYVNYLTDQNISTYLPDYVVTSNNISNYIPDNIITTDNISNYLPNDGGEIITSNNISNYLPEDTETNYLKSVEYGGEEFSGGADCEDGTIAFPSTFSIGSNLNEDGGYYREEIYSLDGEISIYVGDDDGNSSSVDTYSTNTQIRINTQESRRTFDFRVDGIYQKYFNGEDDVEDKVVFESDLEDLKLYKFPNATIYGTPTINNGQISNFSATNYLQFPFIVDFQNRPFQIDLCITTGNNVSTQENIFDSEFGLAFAIKDSHLVLATSTNGINWNVGAYTSTATISPNKTYYLRIEWDGMTEKVSLSLDNSNFFERISVPSSQSPFPKTIIIGKSVDNQHIFSGIINFNYCSLTIADKVVWSGMDDVGLATRLAVDMSNIDAKGEEFINEKIKNYIDNNPPTISIPDDVIKLTDYRVGLPVIQEGVLGGPSEIIGYNSVMFDWASMEGKYQDEDDENFWSQSYTNLYFNSRSLTIYVWSEDFSREINYTQDKSGFIWSINNDTLEFTEDGLKYKSEDVLTESKLGEVLYNYIPSDSEILTENNWGEYINISDAINNYFSNSGETYLTAFNWGEYIDINQAVSNYFGGQTILTSDNWKDYLLGGDSYAEIITSTNWKNYLVSGSSSSTELITTDNWRYYLLADGNDGEILTSSNVSNYLQDYITTDTLNSTIGDLESLLSNI